MLLPTFHYDITLYNQHKHIDADTGKNVTVWKRTVLKNCFFGVQTVHTLDGDTLKQANGFICRIPQNKAYMRYDKWLASGSDEISDHFTLAPDNIVIDGIVYDEISDVQGQRSSDLLNKYKGRSFTVRAVCENTSIPNCPHYKATGV